MAVPTNYKMSKDPAKSCMTCANFDKIISSCNKFVTYVDKSAVCDAWKSSTAAGALKAAQALPAPSLKQPDPVPPTPAPQQAPPAPVVPPPSVSPTPAPPPVAAHTPPSPAPVSLAPGPKVAEAIEARSAVEWLASLAPSVSAKKAADEEVKETIVEESVTAPIEAVEVKAATYQPQIGPVVVKEAVDRTALNEILSRISGLADVIKSSAHEPVVIPKPAPDTTPLLAELSKKMVNLTDAVKTAQAEKPVISVEAPKVVMESNKAALAELSTKMSALITAVKAASADRPTIHVEPPKVVMESNKMLDEISHKLSGLTEAVKSASADRPTIHVEPAKVMMADKPKHWVFTVGAHVPGEEYKVKAEAVEVQ